jgi:thiol-disulfide isomerase/thioredoxin
MKYFFAAFLFLIMIWSPVLAQNTPSSVRLKGVLKNFPDKVEIEDFSEFQYLRPCPKDRIIESDESGNFDITFQLSKPNYFRIGRNVLYLTPGDDFTVALDRDAPLSGTFEGHGSAANTYLNDTPFPKAGSFLEAGRNIRPTLAGTVYLIDSMAGERQKRLDALKGISGEFIRLENARIRADRMKSYAGIDGYSRQLLKTMPEAAKKIYLDSAQAFLKAQTARLIQGFVDASLMQLAVYRDLYNYLPLDDPSSPAEDVHRIREWRKASMLIDQINRESDKSKLSAIKPSIDSLQDSAFRDAVLLTLAEKLKFGKGDPAIDFTVTNSDRNTTTLSSLKGKVIYIDVWATWCGPCMAEMPNLELLIEKYKEQPELAIVSISVDDRDQIWLNNLAKRKPEGIQWHINRINLSAYDVASIPRYILIGKDFKVVDLDAPRPSDASLPALLESLLAK